MKIYSIANLILKISIDSVRDISLPSFSPFLLRMKKNIEECLHIEIQEQPTVSDILLKDKICLAKSQIQGGIIQLFEINESLLLLTFNINDLTHKMYISSDFSKARILLSFNSSSTEKEMSIAILINIIFAQYAIMHDVVLMHASSVIHEDLSFVFLGKSGAGKSTHAQQWLSGFKNCALLNDDCVAVKIKEGKAFAYGTPWGGKTNCYRNVFSPVCGIIRIIKAKSNKFSLLSPSDSFTNILPSCMAFYCSDIIQERLLNLVVEISSSSCIGILECLPNIESAKLVWQSLSLCKI